MKYLISILIAIFFTSAAIAGGYERIDASELSKMLADEKKEVIVDVREAELFKSGHIPGAINIEYNGAKDRILKELRPEDTIVFVCHGGPMGDTLSKILVKNGFTKVYNLKGGMYGWRGELEKD